MKKTLFILLCFLVSQTILMAQENITPTLKSILLEQLKTTHTNKEWFVPINIALEGLTVEQVNWADGSGNHSVGQLATHLLFWNQRLLMEFKGEKPAAFQGKNDDTFSKVDEAAWQDIVKKLDAVMTEWELLLASATEEKLKDWYSNIAKMGTHNAYHTGQIIYVRKLQGSWDGKKGVK